MINRQMHIRCEIEQIEREIRQIDPDGALFGYVGLILGQIDELELKIDKIRAVFSGEQSTKDALAKAGSGQRILELLLGVKRQQLSATDERTTRVNQLTLRQGVLENELSKLKQVSVRQLFPELV